MSLHISVQGNSIITYIHAAMRNTMHISDTALGRFTAPLKYKHKGRISHNINDAQNPVT
jgi:hypothetical protein